MSTLLKWVIAIIVIVGIGFLVWWSGWFRNTSSDMQAAVATSTATTATTTEPIQTNGMSQANDSSDAAIAQDAAAVDVQMQALGKDDAGVAASLADKPITQSY